MSSLNGLHCQLESLSPLDQTRLIMAVCEGLIGDFAARINRTTDPLNWRPVRRVELLDKFAGTEGGTAEIEAMLVYLHLVKGKSATADARRRAEAKAQAQIAKRATLVRGERITPQGDVA